MELVETLELSGPEIDDAVLSANLAPLLAEPARVAAIRFVFLDRTTITRAGFKLVQSFDNAEWVDLSYCEHLDDVALLGLGMTLRSLSVLNVQGTNLGDDWLPCVRGMLRLSWLGVFRTRVTREAVLDLRDAMPRTTIVSSHGLFYVKN